MNTFMEPGNYRQTQILGSLGQRLSAFCAGHWDLNTMWLLREDLQACLSLLGGQLSSTVQQSINNIIHVLTHCIDATNFPDSGQTAQLAILSHDLYVADSVEIKTDTETSQINITQDTETTRAETPPKGYWRQWSEDAMPSQALSSHAPVVSITQEAPLKGTTAMQQDDNENQAEASVMSSELNATSRHLRIYHLTDYSALSIELDQLLEKQGFDVELLGTEQELQELLLALPADLVLIDASYSKNSEQIQFLIADYKKTSAKPLIAVQLSAEADAAETVSSANSAIDVVYSQNTDAISLVAHIDQLLKFGKGKQYRVLIVEDDRSQAMFAEGILRNAEISTKVLLSAENLLPTIEEFKPDLILMDMYLPNANGIQLTELIRHSSHFQNTPIVFLSGEADEDKQMDALEAGGDDFLTKPIRPRKLIATVQNRIKRHRALQLGVPPEPLAVNTNGGLMHRTDMLDCLKKNINSSDHALMYIELNGLNLLKDRLGLSSLENLLKQFSQFLIKTFAIYPIARFSDGAFVMIYQGDCTDSALQTTAIKIRRQLMAQTFNVQDQIIEPRIQIGICHFEHSNNTDLLITTAERTARSARAEPSGVLIYKPQASGEMLKEQRIVSLLNETNQGSALSHVYQPIVAVAGSDEKQFQTLIRLSDENGQVIPAAEFIPIAEKSNLIIGIDRWSISKAVATIAEQAKANNEMKLFVNQSNVTMLDAEHLGWLKNLLKANKIPDNCLVIEINHDDALLNQKSIHDFCKALIYSGVQFCLSRYNPKNDDSNLLESLPLSYVKLAHKFTSGSATLAVRDQIKLLVDRAHRQGLEVIGHSIEDAQTAATLWMSGIDYIQGNLVQSANNHLDFGFDQSVL